MCWGLVCARLLSILVFRSSRVGFLLCFGLVCDVLLVRRDAYLRRFFIKSGPKLQKEDDTVVIRASQADIIVDAPWQPPSQAQSPPRTASPPVRPYLP